MNYYKNEKQKKYIMYNNYIKKIIKMKKKRWQFDITEMKIFL